ncbi:MAG: PEP-CTERM sorting domain-containing protein [Fimbriimonadaceae bacterium]
MGGPYAYAINQLDIVTVPEPGTMIAIGAGLAALVARRRRK